MSRTKKNTTTQSEKKATYTITRKPSALTVTITQRKLYKEKKDHKTSNSSKKTITEENDNGNTSYGIGEFDSGEVASYSKREQILNNLSLKLINTQIAEYDKLINLANTLNQPQLVEAVKESKSKLYATKREYDDYLNAEVSSNTTTISNNNGNLA